MTKKKTCVWVIAAGYLGALAACSDGAGAGADEQTKGSADGPGFEEGSRVNKGRGAALATPDDDSSLDPNALPAAGGTLGSSGGAGGAGIPPGPTTNGGAGGGPMPEVSMAGAGGNAGSGVGGSAGFGLGGTGGTAAGGMMGSGGSSSVSVPGTGGATPSIPNITLMAKVIKTKLLVADVIYTKQIKLGVARIGEMSESKQEKRYEMAKGAADIDQPSVRANVIYAEDIEADEVQAKQLFAQEIQYF
ncbi:MAG: hypothetical protein SF187_21960 [Deltaproteobacteria bacterium]|nr:hypothetical protein [Deltaproteobacteria bacterium]